MLRVRPHTAGGSSQRKILTLVASGLSNTRIALKLNVNDKTPQASDDHSSRLGRKRASPMVTVSSLGTPVTGDLHMQLKRIVARRV